MEFIEHYWQILVTLVSVVIAFTNVKAQNAEQERRINCLEGQVKDINPILMEIREKLASIEATLKYLTK